MIKRDFLMRLVADLKSHARMMWSGDHAFGGFKAALEPLGMQRIVIGWPGASSEAEGDITLALTAGARIVIAPFAEASLRISRAHDEAIWSDQSNERRSQAERSCGRVAGQRFCTVWPRRRSRRLKSPRGIFDYRGRSAQALSGVDAGGEIREHR